MKHLVLQEVATYAWQTLDGDYIRDNDDVYEPVESYLCEYCHYQTEDREDAVRHMELSEATVDPQEANLCEACQ